MAARVNPVTLRPIHTGPGICHGCHTMPGRDHGLDCAQMPHPTRLRMVADAIAAVLSAITTTRATRDHIAARNRRLAAVRLADVWITREGHKP